MICPDKIYWTSPEDLNLYSNKWGCLFILVFPNQCPDESVNMLWNINNPSSMVSMSDMTNCLCILKDEQEQLSASLCTLWVDALTPDEGKQRVWLQYQHYFRKNMTYILTWNITQGAGGLIWITSANFIKIDLFGHFEMRDGASLKQNRILNKTSWSVINRRRSEK